MHNLSAEHKGFLRNLGQLLYTTFSVLSLKLCLFLAFPIGL